jgi:hypothetical protein
MEFKSIKMDRCWCCGERDSLHEHHCIPQAYGGVDGPTVTLCGVCHNLIHAAALKRMLDWNTVLPSKNPQRHGKLTDLTMIIWRARMACKDIDKPMLIQTKLSTERGQKLRKLKTMLGCSSINATLDKCIDVMYDQLTPRKK